MNILNQISISKYVSQTLRKIYGLGQITIKKIIGILAFLPNVFGIHLSSNSVIHQVHDMLSSLIIEFKLRLSYLSFIYNQIINGTYRGLRRIQGLPCRGQRTHANAKTPKRLKKLGQDFPLNIKHKINFKIEKNELKKTLHKIKIKKKLSIKQKGKLKAKNKLLKKNKIKN